MNMLMMMTANLVGFVIGVDGVKFLIAQLTDSWAGSLFLEIARLPSDLTSILGIQFLVAACACLFVGVQIMFEYR